MLDCLEEFAMLVRTHDDVMDGQKILVGGGFLPCKNFACIQATDVWETA